MKADQVDKALTQKFITEEERLVFWNDPSGEFARYIKDGLPSDLSDVTVLDENQKGGLAAKLLLEREDSAGKYLIYSTGDLTPPDEDWLLDIRLYSGKFSADVASLWLEELGLSSLYLSGHLKAREAFMGSQERRQKLKKLIEGGEDEAAIDLKMMTVLAGSSVASFFSIVRVVCHGHLKDGRLDLN